MQSVSLPFRKVILQVGNVHNMSDSNIYSVLTHFEIYIQYFPIQWNNL